MAMLAQNVTVCTYVYMFACVHLLVSIGRHMNCYECRAGADRRSVVKHGGWQLTKSAVCHSDTCSLSCSLSMSPANWALWISLLRRMFIYEHTQWYEAELGAYRQLRTQLSAPVWEPLIL